MKNEKQGIDPALGCTFTAPAGINYARIKTLDKYLRKSVPRQYRGLSGRVFNFEFATTKERDIFLSELQHMIEFRGNQVELVNVAEKPVTTAPVHPLTGQID